MAPERFTEFAALFSGISNGFTFGIGTGYMSMSLLGSFSDDPHRPFNLTSTQLGSLGGATNLSAPFGSFLGGFVAAMFGRKRIMFLLLFPMACGWVIIGTAKSFTAMYFGRLLCGFAQGIRSTSTSTYVSETSKPKVSHAASKLLKKLPNTTQHNNIMNFLEIVGAVLNWKFMAFVNALAPFVFLPLIAYTPESPIWLLSKGRKEEAYRSLQRLRGERTDVEPEFVSMAQHMEKEGRTLKSWRDIFSDWDYIRPVLLLVPMIILRNCTGWMAIQSYSLSIFQTAGSGSISPRIAAITLGSIQFLVFLCSGYAMDKFGRKRISLYSSVIMGVSEIALGTAFYMQTRESYAGVREHLPWISLTSMMVAMSAYALGVGGMHTVLVNELIPVQIKSHATGIMNAFNQFINFLILQTYFIISERVKPYGVFWMYGSSCFGLALFAIHLLPETKGQSIMEIERRLTKSNLRTFNEELECSTTEKCKPGLK
ncbi:unnamed protein product [Cyprideis torosa]|uniref:Uncharacterized protein n=1 Tax=Cyprideis torosa TaxID=163714 RepID=A0A7R8WN73_9CRUS|nr:unnamed protein product [Cyprideis torosa]CAG0900098.1 unnamed protein product [Cyprideis torosa]